MTGQAGAATMFDIEQVEILRGPQGTAFGANALAGIINLKSTEQTEESSGFVSAKIGNYNSQNISTAFGKKITENLSARIGIQSNKSDGYVSNQFLDREDTNGFDEQTIKAKIKWEEDLHSYSLNVIDVKTDNGYDVFTIDNSRNTYSDEPGKDTIDLTGASFKTSNTTPIATIETNTEFSQIKSLYSFDYDWLNEGYREHSGTDYEALDRDIEKGSFDIRLLSTNTILDNSTSWIVGAYTNTYNEDLTQIRTTNSAPDVYDNYFESTSTSLYSELKTNLSASSTLTYGIRIENWNAEFSDINGLDDSKSETLIGGKIAIDSLISANHLAYASLSRGYKPGGFNADSTLNSDQVKFDTEYNWSTEVGLKSSLINDRLTSNIALFYMSREDLQVKNSFTPDNGTTWIDSINNAASGKNYGLEVETSFIISDLATLNLALGLLETEINDFTRSSGSEDISGRNQAHAPSYTFSSSIDFSINNAIKAKLEVEGKDAFYFSDGHDARSEQYQLLNASITYEIAKWNISLTGKNLTDEKIETRGFSGWVQDPQFYVDPATAYTPGKYVQFGEPRLISLAARYNF